MAQELVGFGPVVRLETVMDISRPQLRLKAFQDKVDGAGLAAFMQGFAAPYLQDRVHERFEQQGDRASGKWMPLAQSTIARREKKGYVPIKINERTGVMRRWIEQAPGSIKAVKYAAILEWPGKPFISTTARKLKTAQFGKKEPWTWARPIVAFDSADLLTILVAMEQWIGVE